MCESHDVYKETEEEESGVEFEYCYSWKFVNYDEAKESNLLITQIKLVGLYEVYLLLSL